MHTTLRRSQPATALPNAWLLQTSPTCRVFLDLCTAAPSPALPSHVPCGQPASPHVPNPATRLLAARPQHALTHWILRRCAQVHVPVPRERRRALRGRRRDAGVCSQLQRRTAPVVRTTGTAALRHPAPRRHRSLRSSPRNARRARETPPCAPAHRHGLPCPPGHRHRRRRHPHRSTLTGSTPATSRA